MWTSACFDGLDAGCREGGVLDEEFAVFAGEDVVCDSGDGVLFAEGETEGEHQGCLAASYGAGVVLVGQLGWWGRRWKKEGIADPPMPTVKARSFQSLPSIMGSSRAR